MKRERFLLFDIRFAEEAVFRVLQGRLEAEEYHAERERVYEIRQPEEREQAFRELNQKWFLRLGLAQEIEQALAEQPSLCARVKGCTVFKAPATKDEGAELFVNSAERLRDIERYTVRLSLRPESLLNRPALLTLLRHELFHIFDMLNPSFGYEPRLPAAGGGPTHDSLLRDRYRVLWDMTIDGRMVRKGWLSDTARSHHCELFSRTFPMLGAETEKTFSHFFDQEFPTHAELVAFARSPQIVTSSRQPGSRCPLCGFPTHAFDQSPELLPPEVIAGIRADYPKWQPADGLCVQCADLYRAQRLSAAAAMTLPGMRSRPVQG